MDPKEIKQLLKEAKENLKKNDCMGAAKACKTILKKEPENYQANLLLGTAYRDQGKYLQALEAYKKATQIDGKQVYAWQGVISVYEKQNIKIHTDLLDAYKRVATHFEKDDKQKYIENTIKLANILVSQQDSSKALKVIARLAKSAGLNLEISQLLVQLLNSTTSETRTPEEDQLYTSALEVLVTESPQPAEETYKKLFSQLYRNKQYQQLARKCIDMQDQWNFYHSPIEFICRLYLESNVDSSLLKQECGGIEKITDKLFKLYPSSKYGYFARGKYLIEEAYQYLDGFTWINNALESYYNVHAALILVRGKLKFGDYEGGLEEAKKAIANCRGTKQTDFVIKFELLQMEGLIFTNEVDRADEIRLNLAETFNDTPDHPQIVPYLDLSLQTAVKKKQFEAMDELISAIEAAPVLNGLPSWRLDYYKSIRDAAKSENKFSTNLQSLLLTYPDFPELMLAVGVFLYDQEEYEVTADILTNLVGTMEGRNHPHTWKYLGLIAHLDGDNQKAAKYLRKSYDLNLDSDVGALLCDIYHEMGEFELKRLLLIDAAKKVVKTKSKWVWSRLGLLYLDQGDLIQAVESLQCAIRVDIDDGFLWEALADAYFYRGSLQAALRCYNRAIELGVNPIYPNMRISSIYQSLEEEDKAIMGLKELVEENPTNSPILLELARIYSWVTTEKVKENFDMAAISAAENGIASAVKAIFHADTTMTTALPWLLIGDYSISMGDLPETTIINVPQILTRPESEKNSEEKILTTEKISLKQFKEIGVKALLQCLQIINDLFSNLKRYTVQEKSEMLAYLNHQVALSYYKRSIHVQDKEERNRLLLTGIQYGKKALIKFQNNSLYWNTMGLMAFYLNDAPFSLNCFIKAVKSDGNNVEAWANLGMLYVHRKQFVHAHQAFSKGQCVAPLYAISWIGQGICAENFKQAELEAPDLFRHACLLQHHPYAIAAFGNSVCKLLLELSPNPSEDELYWYHHLFVKLDGVTQLYDLISRIEGREASPQLYNLKGIVAGWNGFHQTSLESFNAAIKLCSGSNIRSSTLHGTNLAVSEKEKVAFHSNLVSSMISLKMFDSAFEQLKTFPDLDCIDYANTALVSYKLNDPSMASEMYQKIIHSSKVEDTTTKAKIALAILLSRTEGVNSAKTILFGKDMIKNPRSLLTLGAIAISENNHQLLCGVLEALSAYECDSRLASDICFFRVCQQLLQKKPEAAVKAIFKFIHMHPTNPRLYALACQVIIKYALGRFSVSIPRHLALCTLKISQLIGSSREDGHFASQHSGIASLTHLIECDDKVAIRLSLKAIRCYPEQRDNWAILACAYWLQYTKLRLPQLFLNVINILDREINLKLCSERIHLWMSSFREEVAKYSLTSSSS